MYGRGIKPGSGMATFTEHQLSAGHLWVFLRFRKHIFMDYFSLGIITHLHGGKSLLKRSVWMFLLLEIHHVQQPEQDSLPKLALKAE